MSSVNGFQGSVVLGASGGPQGISSSLGSSSVYVYSGGYAQTTLTISLNFGASLPSSGFFQVSVTGTAGLSSMTTYLNLDLFFLNDVWSNNAYFQQETYTGNIDSAHFGNEPALIAMDSGSIYMYYRAYELNSNGNQQPCGNGNNYAGIGIAISSDGGLTFQTGSGEPFVYQGSLGSWDDCQIISPSVIKVGGTFYMVYEGNSINLAFSPGEVGMATSSDGTSWQKSTGPIINPSGSSGWESANIGTPSLMYQGGTFYVFYHGDECFPSSLYGCSTERRNKVGFASGPSLTALSKNPGNPVLDVGKGIYRWESHVVSRATVFREGQYYYMFFEGSSDQTASCGGGNWGWGIARSTDLQNWDRFWGNPIRQKYQAKCGDDNPYVFAYNGDLYLYQRELGIRSRLTPGPDPSLWAWQAESQLSHQIGRLDSARQSTGEAVGWSASTGTDAVGYLTYGPYTTQLPTGNYAVTWRLLIDDHSFISNDQVVNLDVNDATHSTSLSVSQATVSRWDFQGNYAYQDFERQFSGSLGTSYKFRVLWNDKAYIKQDYAIARLLPPS